MNYFDKYKTRLLANGENLVESKKELAKKIFQSEFTSSPSHHQVLINDYDIPIDVRIVDDTQDMKKIISLSSTPLNTGDIINWNGDIWILIKSEFKDSVYYRGIMKYCPSTLKWLDSEGHIKEVPFTFKSSPLSTYEYEEDKIMILSKERRLLLIPDRPYTRQIERNQKFIFDNRAWSVNSIDTLQTKGIIFLIVEEDKFNDALDNKELRIANYYGNVANYRIEVLNGNAVSIFDKDTLQLNIKVYNNGRLLDNPELSFESSDENIVVVDHKGLVKPQNIGVATIKVSYQGVFSIIQINVIESLVNNYTAEIIGNSEIVINQSATYTVKFYHNGIPIPDNAVFSLVADDGSPTNLASITSTTNSSCTIKAHSLFGYVKLQVMNQNGLIKTEKRIRLKSLI